MSGLSYASGTAWAAAVEAPPALKTIVTAGDVTDPYQFAHSPQGTWSPTDGSGMSAYDLTMGLTAGAHSGSPSYLQRKTCPQAGQAAQNVTELATGVRDAAYWQERNLSLRLPAVRAAVLDTTGYLDIPTQHWQADAVWGSLSARTPKVQIRGWWAHMWPDPLATPSTKFDLPSGTTTWETIVLRWLDFWLKGVGPRPQDRVYHQDQELRWHESSTWSARPRGKQVLYLSHDRLSPSPQQGSTSFRSAPPPDLGLGEQIEGIEPAGSGLQSTLCQDAVGAALSRRYLTAPVTSRTLVAGNPMAYLRLSSDQPGGIVSAAMYDLAPDFACTGQHQTGARWISWGSADLSFYRTPFASHAFPVATPTNIRIDLSDVTYALAPGHRLALVLSYGEPWRHGGTTAFPTITVQGTSQLVVPVAEGTLGGKRPTLRYPQRPFAPRGYRD
jgi:putative CocE/NonD family hydrolase